jgi:hypothetical protein
VLLSRNEHFAAHVATFLCARLLIFEMDAYPGKDTVKQIVNMNGDNSSAADKRSNQVAYE